MKVALKAVNWEVMKSWIAKRVTELLGLEDEVVIGYIYEQLEGKEVLLPCMVPCKRLMTWSDYRWMFLLSSA